MGQCTPICGRSWDFETTPGGAFCSSNFFSLKLALELSINVMKQPITVVIGIQIWPKNLSGGVTYHGNDITSFSDRTRPGVKCAEVWQNGCPRGWRGRVESPGGSWGTSIGFQMVKIQGVRQGCPKGPRCMSRGSQGVRHDICPTFYTPWFSGVICVICNIFDSQLNNVNAYTSAGGQGGGFISPGLVSDFLQECTWNEKAFSWS